MTNGVSVCQLIFRRQFCMVTWSTARASIGRCSVVTMATVCCTISSISDTNTSVSRVFGLVLISYHFVY